jgi:hypothetical protein
MSGGNFFSDLFSSLTGKEDEIMKAGAKLNGGELGVNADTGGVNFAQGQQYGTVDGVGVENPDPTQGYDATQVGEQPAKKEFDYKDMVSTMSGLAKQNKITPANTAPMAAGGGAQPIMMPTGMQPAQSGAMGAIQQGMGANNPMMGMIGGQPSREELMRRMQMR